MASLGAIRRQYTSLQRRLRLLILRYSQAVFFRTDTRYGTHAFPLPARKLPLSILVAEVV